MLISLPAPTRKGTGCLNYDLHISAKDPAIFLYHENWTTKAALDGCLQNARIRVLLPRMDELCVGMPEVKIWEHLDGGGSAEYDTGSHPS